MRKILNQILTGILLLSLFTPFVLGQDYTSDSLSVEIYTDGTVDVTYVVEPDTTLHRSMCLSWEKTIKTCWLWIKVG